MTSLVPQGGDKDIKPSSLYSVLKALGDRKLVAEPESFDGDTETLSITEDAQEAAYTLIDDLDATHFPTRRRTLTPDEQADIVVLGRKAKMLDPALKKIVAAAKKAFFAHLDLKLEEDNDPKDLPRAEDGTYLVGGEMSIPGTGLKITRELKQASPDITVADLKRLWDEGKISREVYYRATRKLDIPREIDEEGLLGVFKDRPDLYEVIKEGVTPGKITSSFWIKKDAP